MKPITNSTQKLLDAGALVDEHYERWDLGISLRVDRLLVEAETLAEEERQSEDEWSWAFEEPAEAA
ncbi:hypothetical protein KR100_11930 [Synechococcus sp. KORDI-100]|uniref:hypothetical protein n=1 Tax=Synechococcus sp. KORDI-100 TaxID=1280380 RepID=UPI0004E06CA3|nr:hypothetical protein [Synechococcus sp. KORDI-100]AII44058.1 hypothetical protein KR100_11930 [Synechococcus sp. KORDI-100]